jgi:quercetin 2,3-dioxygenase
MTTEVAAEECTALNRQEVFETNRSRQTALGDLTIWRALPVRQRRLVGPWCFLDRYGPLSFDGGKPMDVAPHPHIGLQTVSWLFDGEVQHKDSIGGEGVVRPGGVNIMSSGRGIAHAEETPKRNSGRLDGVQLWVALPDAYRQMEPSFDHLPEVPRIDFRGGSAQLFAGSAGDARNAVAMYSDIVGLDVVVHRGEALTLPVELRREHGIFLVEGDATFERQPLQLNTLHYLGCGRSELALHSREGARLLLLGGEPFAEPVLMWWNFVARTPEEIAAARAEWEEGSRFGEVTAYDGPRLAAPPLSKVARPNPAS